MRQDGLPPNVMFSSNGNSKGLTAETLGTRKKSLRVSRSGSFGDLGSNPMKMGVPKRVPSLSGQLESKVHELQGTKAIHSVLVANNGMAAVKFIRSIQDWAYKFLGHEKAIALVAMATPEDMRVGAEHIRMADQFVEVPGGANANNYANVRLILQTAEKCGVDAVWPGWGHASEKPELPAALAETAGNIRFLGPPAPAMAALGDKVGSTILAQAAGVPTLPWSGSDVSVSYKDCGGKIPADVYDKACIHNVKEALDCCQRIEYPCMLKASWGGGGKGIRKVVNDDEVRMAFKQVQGEVPGSPIFAMKLAPQSRHLEVQLLCDQSGNVVSIFSRDCSVQRRHQKIVEEGPVSKASASLLRDMEACARALARSVGYVGAATVEFLYGLASQEYYFLELNPRLQVEHPVTEWISNVNIPSCQLMIGMGIRLDRMADIRRLFGRDPEGSDRIDFERDPQVKPAGAVVAVRITSEDADDGFKPTCGSIEELNFRNSPDVWGYFSVKSGGGIHEFSDSQFGHLFAKGDTRDAAIRAMVVALKQVKIRGEIRTIVDYTTEMIQHQTFVGNQHHTGWLDSRIAANVRTDRPPWHLSVICGALLRVIQQVNGRSADYLGFLEKGQLPPAKLTLTSFEEQLVLEGTKYIVQVHRRAPDTYSLALASSSVDAVTRTLTDGSLLVQVDGLSHVVHSEEEAMGTRITVDSLTCLLANESDPSRLVAISPGKLIRYLMPDGAHVDTDQPYAEVEVMKMMMPLLSSAAGHLHFQKPESSVLNPGDLIAKLDLDDPEAVTKAELYKGTFPELGPPQVYSIGVDHRFKQSLHDARMILAGYDHPVDDVVNDLVDCLDDLALPLMQFTEEFAVVQTRLSADFVAELEAILAEHEGELEVNVQRSPKPGQAGPAFPALLIHKLINQHILAASEADKTALQSHLTPLLSITAAHLEGSAAYARQIGHELFGAFLDVEELFQHGRDATEQEIIDELRQVHSQNLQQVLDIVVSHQALGLKCQLLLKLLLALVAPAPEHYRSLLRRLAGLTGPATAEVAIRAQQLLEHSLLTELRGVVARTLAGVDMFTHTQLADILGTQHNSHSHLPADSPLATGDSAAAARRSTVAEGLYSGLVSSPFAAAHAVQGQMEAKLRLLVEAPAAVEDALASLVNHVDPQVQRRAVETYVKRVYHPFMQRQPSWHDTSSALTLLWTHNRASSPTPGPDTPQLGAAVVIPSLQELPEALPALLQAIAQQGLSAVPFGTFHIILTEDLEIALDLSPAAQAYQAQAAATVMGRGAAEHPEELHLRAGNRRAITAAVIAQIWSMDSTLAQAGFWAISVLVQRPQMAPVRCGFWRAASTAPDASRAPVRPAPAKESPPLAASDSTLPHAGLPRAPSSGQVQSGPLQPAKSTDARPPKHRRSGSGSKAFQGPFSYVPDVLLGPVEPFTAQALELEKLAGFKGKISYSPTRNRQCHMYTVVERPNARSIPLKRAFLRGVVHGLGQTARLQQVGSQDVDTAAQAVLHEVEQYLVNNLVELERAGASGSSKAASGKPDWSHVYLTVLDSLPLHDPGQQGLAETALRAACAGVMSRQSTGLRRAGVAQWELRLRMPTDLPAWRLVVSSPTGHEAGEEDVQVYQESNQNGTPVYHSLGQTSGARGPLHGSSTLTPYPPFEALQQKRLAARRHKSTFAYDFPNVFANAQRKIWLERQANGEPDGPLPARFVETQELVMPAGASFRAPCSLEAEDRPMGRNTVGVVAWLMLLRTPEYPEGRQVVAIANDITFNSGAFGPKEDAAFRAATEYALQHQLPVMYLAANSGARVGLANEIKQCLRVEWVSPREPQKGFQYLYLSDDDYQSINGCTEAEVVRCEEVQVGSERRWRLTDVVGEEDGLGIECLSGSGAIASVYARAFREGFTITLVSGRTVGIGAYLARLGRRCVQRADQPIILTGYSALNKLLGREVYSSQLQLGGPKVMGVNGVSHHIVEDDLAGVETMLKWLAFVPATLPGAPATLRSADPISRTIEYAPEKGEKLDPRAAIGGRFISRELPGGDATASTSGRDAAGAPASAPAGQGHWQSGLFDKGSWIESQAGWARSVVTGRARLAGVACGVIAVETQTVMMNIPADPGMPDSMERTIPQAGQVWFPNSALKTAEAMEEFDREQLPLVILANWRGFSGGQRDLFEGVLQAGSLIVENLRTYRQPVIVYLPPGAELRGGAWVVIDGQINSAQVEMYADPTAAGGVLEPEGIVEIKFRTLELIAMMHRLDPVILHLKAEGGSGMEGSVKAREQLLLPVYHSVAVSFAQMHDSPVRMVAKGVVRGVVPWQHARPFLAHRLCRRVAEAPLIRALQAGAQSTGLQCSQADAVKQLQKWFYDSLKTAQPLESSSPLNGVNVDIRDENLSEDESRLWADDKRVIQWIMQFTDGGQEGNEFQKKLTALEAQATATLVQTLVANTTGQAGVLTGLRRAFREQPQLKERLQQLLEDHSGRDRPEV